MFEHIILERVQKELLFDLVEAARMLPADRRAKFMFLPFNPDPFIFNQRLRGWQLPAYGADIRLLAEAGLLDLSHGKTGSLKFDVHPRGFEYYRQMKQRLGEPVERLETELSRYLNARRFQDKYPLAYQKWSEAETLLWSSDTEEQLTTIGHLCREALQEFATALVEVHQPPDVDQDKEHTIARVRAVLELEKPRLIKAERRLLDALLTYWVRVNDLVQRQEHGGQKKGDALVWEDGRRVVFQSVIAMFEIDRSLSHSS